MIQPEDFGLERGTKDEIVGGTAKENAQITRGILNGTITGTRRNIVLLNAGAALYAGKAAETLEEGVKLATELIDTGKALETLNKVIEVSGR